MRVAIDRNGDGVIDNIIEAESVEVASALYPSDVILDAVAAGVQIGWVADGVGGYEAPPPNPPTYRLLSSADLVSLVRSAGGSSAAQVVACRNDANLAFFWFMLEITPYTRKDHPDLVAGLTAIDALGYIPNGFQAVLDGWPEA